MGVDLDFNDYIKKHKLTASKYNNIFNNNLADMENIELPTIERIL